METISEVLGLDTKDHVLKILCSGADLPVCLVYYHPVATADSFKHSTNGIYIYTYAVLHNLHL